MKRAGGLNRFLATQGGALGLAETQRQALREGRLEIDFLDYDWRLNRTR